MPESEKKKHPSNPIVTYTLHRTILVVQLSNSHLKLNVQKLIPTLISRKEKKWTNRVTSREATELCN